MRSARPTGMALLAIPAAAAAAALLGPTAAAAAPLETTPLETTPLETTPSKTAVQIKDFAFSGKVAQVRVGETVTWVNRGATPHLAKSTAAPVAFASPKLAAGESWSFTFTKPGTYAYVCKLHPKMKATVVAAPAVVEEKVEQVVATDATAAAIDTEGGRGTLLLFGSLGFVLLLGVAGRAMPGLHTEPQTEPPPEQPADPE